MQQYWINQNGEQKGPFTLEQIKELRLSDEDYAWFSGLNDWVKLSQVPELASLLEEQTIPPADGEEQAAPEGTPQVVPQTAEIDVDEMPRRQEAPSIPSPAPQFPPQQLPVNPVAPSAAQPSMPQQPFGGDMNVQPVPPAQPPQQMPFPAQMPMQQPMANGMEPQPECPPTNLGWAIAATLLCCLPVGVIAIITSFKVSKAYNAGDMELAKRWSDRTAWWIIASIILGIVSSPIQSLLQMLILK